MMDLYFVLSIWNFSQMLIFEWPSLNSWRRFGIHDILVYLLTLFFHILSRSLNLKLYRKTIQWNKSANKLPHFLSRIKCYITLTSSS